MPRVWDRGRRDVGPDAWRRRLERWFHQHRPQIAAAIAFSVAALLGVLAASTEI